MNRKSIFAAGIVSALCMAGGAQAQSAGSFAGQSADGNTISLTVTDTAGVFEVTGMSVGFMADCKRTGGSVSEGWGFFLGDDISSGATDFNSHNDYYYITGSMHFSGNNTIKGTITSYTATFVPGATPPKQAQYCVSPKQAFTLAKQSPGAAIVSAAPGTAVALPKPDTK
jgi:hypothetical protein